MLRVFVMYVRTVLLVLGSLFTLPTLAALNVDL